MGDRSFTARKEHEEMPERYSTWILIVFLLLLIGCTPSQPQQTIAVSTKSPINVPTATSTPVAPIPTVGPVPQSCPTSNPTRRVFSQLSSVTGSTPVWATWIPDPSVFREGSFTNSNPPTNYDPAYGWQITKVVWEVGPNYTQPISIHGYELLNHTPMFIQIEDTPTAHTVLDSHHPSHPRSVLGDGWAEWGSYIVVPKAGCYRMDVSWPTGHWALNFAFGA